MAKLPVRLTHEGASENKLLFEKITQEIIFSLLPNFLPK